MGLYEIEAFSQRAAVFVSLYGKSATCHQSSAFTLKRISVNYRKESRPKKREPLICKADLI